MQRTQDQWASHTLTKHSNLNNQLPEVINSVKITFNMIQKSLF